MKTGDTVIRKWKPALGEGTILHVLGDKVCVKWHGPARPKIIFEHPKHLKVINESR